MVHLSMYFINEKIVHTHSLCKKKYAKERVCLAPSLPLIVAVLYGLNAALLKLWTA